MTATAPKILVADDWQDYRLLDSGNGGKLEQVGPYRFVRPEPQALWSPRLPAQDWDSADAVFSSGSSDEDETGRWRFARTLPPTWAMRWDDLRFLSRPTAFRHLAFFPEHSVHWRYAREWLHQKGGQPEVLNLFGYTGLASLACASVGAKVTHVDASKKAIGFARENQREAGLSDAPIRWICDDALTFVKREIRRGRRYDGVILDPPKFGRGPNGETWRLEDSLAELIDACQELLRVEPDERGSAQGFFIATVYAVRLSYLALAQTAQQAFTDCAGEWEIGEMALPHASDKRVLPTAIYARWRS
ncbi:MAG: class I SAM-dependent methyltransferase [Proteobacteria bacterium]|nr:class I SAM-dependent methyltransferase [Pseudomonadota bacterium]